jgi:biopolymer transport protein ExbD
MLRFPAKKRARPTIHLTALIDIVFLLLIFFLLASSFVDQQGVVIFVPEVSSEDKELLADIVIKIDREGQIYFGGNTVDENQLLNIIQNVLNRSGRDSVIIEADRRVIYDKVVHIIDVAKLAGAKNLLLVTKRITQE